MASFETVADEYDTARPSYPPGVFDALGDLDGLLVLDVGAGTGIATRAAASARGASVVAIDPGTRRAGPGGDPDSPGSGRSPPMARSCPVQAAVADLICFAQAWHWLDRSAACGEAHRILREGGRWAGWWSHARADDEAWFDGYWSIIEGACPGTHRGQRDTDWGATVANRAASTWTGGWSSRGPREIPVDRLDDRPGEPQLRRRVGRPGRSRLLTDLRLVVERRFPDGATSVRYETWLWTATKR